MLTDLLSERCLEVVFKKETEKKKKETEFFVNAPDLLVIFLFLIGL